MTTHRLPASSAARPTRPDPADAALGDVRRQALRRLQVTLMPFAVAMGITALCVVLGLAEWWQALALVAYTATGLGTFFVMLRSGVTLRWRDPMLAFPQVLFGIGLVALSYAMMDVARAVALEWLCLIIVFDMRRLPRRQTQIAAVLAMALPALGVYLAGRLWPGGMKLSDELLFLGLGSVMVPVLLVVSASARRLRTYRQRQREQMAQTLEQVHALAIRDGLTGLYNRRHMLGLMEAEVCRQQRTGRPFCLAILDIDFFKHINDAHGHAMGDTVLQHFAAVAGMALDGQAYPLARWGGEEFLLVMPETTPTQGQAVLARLQAAVRGHRWDRHAPGLAVRFSAGLSEHRREGGLAQALEAADQALYRAKAEGRDRVALAEPLAGSDPAIDEALSLSSGRFLQDDAEVDRCVAALREPPAAQGSPSTSRPRERDAGDPSRKAGAHEWNLILGKDRAMQASLRMSLAAGGIYVTLMLSMVFYGLPTGLIDPGVGHLLLGIEFIGAVAPYVLVRSGLSARWGDDRMLMVPQMLWAYLGLAVAFVLVPQARPFAAQVLCVVLVFGFIDLSSKQAVKVGLTGIVMWLLAYAWLLHDAPTGFVPVREGVGVAVTVFIVALLTVQSRNLALTRELAREEKHALAATAERFKQLMTRDTLTGLFNRRHVQHLLAQECERHDRSEHAFCVALVDLDHFKKINDTHGHQVGDEALAGFAMAATGLLRETDAIGRWGGEEFLVLLVDTEPGMNGITAAERLREHIASQHLCPTVPQLLMTISAGVAVRRQGEPWAQLLERADQALYAAKAQGRNRCVLAG